MTAHRTLARIDAARMDVCTEHARPEITIDPGRLGGGVTLGGHRLRVEMICEAAWSDLGVDGAGDNWLINRAEVLTCCWYAGIYGLVDKPRPFHRLPRSPWRNRWGLWAATWDEEMWAGRYDAIPDPPQGVSP